MVLHSTFTKTLYIEFIVLAYNFTFFYNCLSFLTKSHRQPFQIQTHRTLEGIISKYMYIERIKVAENLTVWIKNFVVHQALKSS